MTTLSPDHLLEVVLRGYDEAWNRGDLSVLDQLLAPDFRAHDPSAPGGVVDRAGVRTLLQQIRAAFPDLRREALDHVAHGDKIAVRWRVAGTHQGVFAGASPTGRRVEVSGITLYHIPDDRIREEWVALDTAGLARQLSGV